MFSDSSIESLICISEHSQNILLYFTGMDAQVAYGFHHLRNEKPYLASGPISNKVSMELWNVFYKLPSCLLSSVYLI